MIFTKRKSCHFITSQRDEGYGRVAPIGHGEKRATSIGITSGNLGIESCVRTRLCLICAKVRRSRRTRNSIRDETPRLDIDERMASPAADTRRVCVQPIGGRSQREIENYWRGEMLMESQKAVRSLVGLCLIS
jgi:hypothetical protein